MGFSLSKACCQTLWPITLDTPLFKPVLKSHTPLNITIFYICLWIKTSLSFLIYGQLGNITSNRISVLVFGKRHCLSIRWSQVSRHSFQLTEIESSMWEKMLWMCQTIGFWSFLFIISSIAFEYNVQNNCDLISKIYSYKIKCLE